MDETPQPKKCRCPVCPVCHVVLPAMPVRGVWVKCEKCGTEFRSVADAGTVYPTTSSRRKESHNE